MGIDIYARWQGQGEDVLEAQQAVWSSITDGRYGYLREAYHGEPYATRHLVPEAFDAPDGVPIPATTLRERLPETLRLADIRHRRYYVTDAQELEDVRQSYIDFVELCERIERKTGKPVTVIASW